MDGLKKRNAFALCLAAAIGANCLSYFVRSDGGNLHGHTSDGPEAIGFPFLVWHGGGQFWGFYWYSLAGNILVAVVASYAIAKTCADKLPLLWKPHATPRRYSLRTLMGIRICVIVLLVVPVSGPNLHCGVYCWVQWAVRFPAPVALWALCLGLHQASWSRLIAAATGLFLFSVVLDRYFYDNFLSVSVVRTFAPVVGMFCLLVIGHAVCLMIRWKG